jgi:hypothetical protein
MTLPRLLHAGTLEERRLLSAARRDGPQSYLRQRVHFAVGTAAIGPEPARLNFASEGRAAQSATTGIASSVAPWGMPVLVKWVGIASVALLSGLGMGLAAGTAWADRDQPTASTRGAVAQVASRASMVDFTATPTHRVQAAPPAPRSDTTRLSLAPRVAARSAARAAREAVHEKSGSADAFNEEVRLVDEARVALRRGDAAKCLAALAQRQHRFPRGVLSPEASLLRIEALSLSGQREAARTEGNRFLDQQPLGPLAGRVRAVLSQP